MREPRVSRMFSLVSVSKELLKILHSSGPVIRITNVSLVPRTFSVLSNSAIMAA